MYKRKILGLIIIFIVSIGIGLALWYFLFLCDCLKSPAEIVEVDPKAGIVRLVKSFEPQKEQCYGTESLNYFYYVESSWENNNKFGLYIYAEDKDFFEIAQQLVNSNNGDWGYVLIPYNVKDRDVSRWTRVFEQLRNKHLIPIIQLHDVDVDNYREQTEEAAEFLTKFIWPIKPRYISVYNEMNDSRFWYGYLNPEEYAEVLDYTIEKFKDENENFFMMNGAFNVTAPTDNNHLDAFTYMSRMEKHIPGIFNKLDGWASHPYPQPNFSGSPYIQGRTGIQAYDVELNYLKNVLGVSKDLPVFITETGWAHAEGENYNSSYPTVEEISEYFEIAYEEIWMKDDRVRAVTPFTIIYEAPYDHFSWINQDKVPYEHYNAVKSIKKVEGNPPYIDIREVILTKCNEK